MPYLSANLDVTTDASLAPLYAIGKIAKSTVIEEGGELIGVVGATTPTLARISSSGAVTVGPVWAGTTPTAAELDALAAIIQDEVDALLDTNPSMNKVILHAHMQVLGIEEALATRLSGVDVIVAGGSNTRLLDENDRPIDGGVSQGQYPKFITNADGGVTALVNTDGNYKYVGRLVIDFDKDGNIIPDSYDPAVSGAYATDDQGVADLGAEGYVDPEVQAIADAIEAQIIATQGNVFGVSNVFLNGNCSGIDAAGDPDGVRTQETNLGNLTADANLAYARKHDDTVTVSIKNGGGIRASIGETVVPAGSNEAVRGPNGALFDSEGDVIKPDGGISQADIQSALAFNNDLSLITVTRANLVEVLEHAVAQSPAAAGQFAQVSGIQYSFDPSQPAGSRIVSAAISDADGNDIDVLVRGGEIVGNTAGHVRVVTLGFMADGGDGYPFKPLAGRVDLGDLNGDGVADGIRDGAADFASNGSEQDAFAEYLAEFFATPETAYDVADRGYGADDRIQNLEYREDSVIDMPAINVITGNEGRDILNGTAGADMFQFLVGSDQINLMGDDDVLDLSATLANGSRDSLIVKAVAGQELTLIGLEQSDIIVTSGNAQRTVFVLGEDGDAVTVLGLGRGDIAFGFDPLLA